MNEPLFPDAQAVKDHFLANASISLERGLAAALRAASDGMECLIGDTHHPKFAEGVLAAGDLLESIAAELEAPNA